VEPSEKKNRMPKTNHRSSLKRKFVNWQIAFVEDCNLRCSYCSTGFGRFGQTKQNSMKRPVWERLLEFIFSDISAGEHVSFDIQGGEPFLHFDEFLAFVDEASKTAEKKRVTLSIAVTTNGTLLNKTRLELCARHRINMTFSIDGGRLVHNRYRKDKNGLGTHRRAMKNWRSYRKITKSLNPRPACRIQSVITSHSRLSSLVRYWAEQGEKIADCVIQEPSRFTRCGGRKDWHLRRKRYLQDFQKIALQQSSALDIPNFLSRFKGPSSLYELWRDMFLNNSRVPCGVGRNTLGLDSSGNLFPCDAFIGREHWKIGDIFSGIDHDRLKSFTSTLSQLRQRCRSCSIRKFCGGGCCAAGDGDELVLNMEQGCSFMKEIVEIAKMGYKRLEDRMEG